MACRYCGLPIDGGVNHGTVQECLAALGAEVARLETIGRRRARSASAVVGMTVDADQPRDSLDDTHNEPDTAA